MAGLERTIVRTTRTTERRPAATIQRSAAAPATLSSARALQQHLGNRGTRDFAAQVVARSSAPSVTSTSGAAMGRLSVSHPDDAHEREADRVAAVVMRVTKHSSTSPNGSPATRVSRGAVIQRLCAECEEESKGLKVQRKEAANDTPQVTPGVTASIGALRGGGSPLPASTREFFEPRFGADFSQVRVHTSMHAEQTARSLNARAFTVGRDIAFGPGQYTSESHEGRRLLAHELTHIVQQTGGHSQGAATSTRIQRWRWPWEATPSQTELIRQGIDGDTDAIGEITDFSTVPEPQRLTMIDHLTRQVWVGSTDEAALARIWNSFGAGFAGVAGANPLRWRNSVARHSGLYDAIAEARRIRDAFARDVRDIALRNLQTNRAYADGEVQRLGLPRTAAERPPATTAAQSGELARLQVAAEGLAKLQRAQEAAREAFVGYQGVLRPSTSDTPAYQRVRFNPDAPPPLAALPGGSLDMWDDANERWVSFSAFGLPPPRTTTIGEAEEWVASHEERRRLTTVVQYAPLKARYDEATAAIATHLARFPTLYAMSVQGSSTITGRLASAQTPEEARVILGEAFRTLLSNIARTEERLNGGQLDPLDLTPIHQRLFGAEETAPSGINWSEPFPRTVGEMLARDHRIELALRQLLLQNVAQLAFLIAPIAGPLALPLLLAGTTATGANLVLDRSRYTALADAAGAGARPGTQLVTGAAVDEARMAMEADALAFALAVLALGSAAGAAAIRRFQVARQARLAAQLARIPPPVPPGTGAAFGRQMVQEMTTGGFRGNPFRDFMRRLNARPQRLPPHEAAEAIRVATPAWDRNMGTMPPVQQGDILVVPSRAEIPNAPVMGIRGDGTVIMGRAPRIELVRNPQGVAVFPPQARIVGDIVWE